MNTVALDFLTMSAYSALTQGLSVVWVTMTKDKLTEISAIIQMMAQMDPNMKATTVSSNRITFANGGEIGFMLARKTGASMEHVNMLVMDSPSLYDPQLLRELRFIPGRIKDIGPITVQAET